jgi:hypothetical protein
MKGSQMSTNNLRARALAATLLLACGGDDDGAGAPDAAPGQPDAAPQATDVDVADDITASTTWRKGTVYHLKAKAGANKYIMVHPGATLTIEPGTQIRGGEESALIVARGGKLEAAGTAAEPIVFSHDAPAGSRMGGQWGGIVILGRAPTNLAGNDTLFEALPESTGDLGKFGGDDPDDDSGTLRYVRIEFGGRAYTTNREFNGLTLCGVGRGTEIDFVQIHKGTDDGLELFGGTVDVKHVVITQNEDDGLDTDNGWSGRAQFVIVQNLSGATSDGSHGYESDNHPTAASYDATPRTAPTIYNATIVGNKGGVTVPHFGAVLRRGTSGRYLNHLFYNFKDGAVEVRDQQTMSQVTGGALTIQSSIFWNNRADNGTWPASATSPDFDEAGTFAATNGNQTQAADPMLVDALSASAPSFKPASLLGGGATPPGDGFFDPAATFIGAIGETDWTAGWTAYPQD